MATYTTVANIKSYYMGLDVDADYITTADITLFISESSVKIDLTLKKKYVLPFSDADDLTYLKLVCDKMVVCKIDKIMRANKTEEEEKFSRDRGYCKEAKEMLDDLINGKIELTATQKSFKPMKYNATETEDDECI